MPPPAPSPAPLPADPALARVRRLAHLLDDSIRIPGVGRIGVDPLLGLVPGVGDAAGSVLSLYILVEAARLGASRAVLLRMAVNIGVETLLGAVPALGDLFDAGWKANARNVRLLNDYLERPGATRRASWGFLLLLVAVLLVVYGAAIAVWLFLLGLLWEAV